MPANARLVDWVSYTRAMPGCDLVVCHGGHGTVARALASGCAVVVVPAAGDMNENAARVDWAGVGVRLPRRLVGGARPRASPSDERSPGPRCARGARGLQAWAARHDGPVRAAELVEAFATSGSCGRSACR